MGKKLQKNLCYKTHVKSQANMIKLGMQIHLELFFSSKNMSSSSLGCNKCLSLLFHSCRYTKMKTATNIYIFNLALADALATSTLPFQSAKYLMSTWPFGELLCKVVLSIDYYNMFTSIFTLTMMSVDRYIAVCHPVKALDFRTPAKAKLINICIWVLSSVIGVPIMIMAVTKSKGKWLYSHSILSSFVTFDSTKLLLSPLGASGFPSPLDSFIFSYLLNSNNEHF